PPHPRARSPASFAAVIIGALGALVYYGFAKLCLLAKIDDPLEASAGTPRRRLGRRDAPPGAPSPPLAVHGACGLWGVVAVGFFASKENMMTAYGFDETLRGYGVFYGGDGKLLGIQLLGGLTIMAWALLLASC